MRTAISIDTGAMNSSVEYAVLTALSLTISLALFWAAADFYNTGVAEGERIALTNVAARINEVAGEISRLGADVVIELELPDLLGCYPYVVEPDPGGGGLRLHMLKGNSWYWLQVPLLCPGVHMEGFLYSTSGPHRLVFDSGTGRMTLC